MLSSLETERSFMKETEFDIGGLKKSLSTLQEAWDIYNTSLTKAMKTIVADSCIQRYEYTLETSWKIMKKYLKLAYGKTDTELTMNNIFRFMAGYGFISDWERWKYYYLYRNDTTHEYSVKKSQTVLKIIPDFIQDVQELITALDNAK